jgi:hypothetical protein
MLPFIRLGLVVLLFVPLTGCQMLARFNRMLPTTADYDDGTDDTTDPWITAGAEEGRREYQREEVSDPLGLRPYLMSEKARSIEHNVGIGE